MFCRYFLQCDYVLKLLILVDKGNWYFPIFYTNGLLPKRNTQCIQMIVLFLSLLLHTSDEIMAPVWVCEILSQA